MGFLERRRERAAALGSTVVNIATLGIPALTIPATEAPTARTSIPAAIGTKRGSAYQPDSSTAIMAATLNSISIVTKNKTNSRWIKKVPNRTFPVKRVSVETVAQEFLRLMSFNEQGSPQPKTRTCIDNDGTAVHSQYKDGFTSFADIKKKSGELTIQGFGRAILLARFLKHRDLNLGNIGIDADHNVVVLDSEFSMMHVEETTALALPALQVTAEDSHNPISPEELSDLPNINILCFTPNKWLDIYNGLAKNNEPSIFQPFMESPIVKKEIYETLLNLICFSTEKIAEFVSHYVHEDSPIKTDIIHFLTQEHQDYSKAAMKDEGFKTYLKSDNATNRIETTLKYWLTFKLTGKTTLFANKVEQADFQASVWLTFSKLKEQARKRAHQPSESPSSPRKKLSPEKSSPHKNRAPETGIPPALLFDQAGFFTLPQEAGTAATLLLSSPPPSMHY